MGARGEKEGGDKTAEKREKRNPFEVRTEEEARKAVYTPHFPALPGLKPQPRKVRYKLGGGSNSNIDNQYPQMGLAVLATAVVSPVLMSQ